MRYACLATVNVHIILLVVMIGVLIIVMMTVVLVADALNSGKKGSGRR